jgi:hypothetical protein
MSSDSETLRADVERTRERLSEDVEALGTKLSPENLKAEAKQSIKTTVRRGTEQVKDEVSSAGNSVVSFVRANPLPLALIGVGVGWLVWSARSGRDGHRGASMDYATRGRAEVYDGVDYDDAADYDYDDDMASSTVDGARRKIHRLRDQVRDRVDSAKRVASEKASQARGKVEELEHAAQDRMVRARDVAAHTMEDQPLLLGAVALGAGLAVGLGIPATDSENQLVGRYRDQLVSNASRKLSELGDKAGRVAERSFDAAKETAKTSAKEMTEDAAPV